LRDRDALQELGVAECDTVILSVGSDLAASVLAVVNLKAIGVKHLVCKAYDEVHRDVLLKLGADQVLIPEQEFAIKLAAQMISPRLRDQLQLTDDYVIEEVAVPEEWTGKTLGGMNIRNRYDVTVLTVRHGDRVVPAPRATEQILSGDVLLLLGDRKAMAAVRRLR
jgi:trk system potassium uptake protein TrkA